MIQSGAVAQKGSEYYEYSLWMSMHLFWTTAFSLSDGVEREKGISRERLSKYASLVLPDASRGLRFQEDMSKVFVHSRYNTCF